MPTPHDVFISYSQRDRHTAMAVCHTLEARGVRCWMAPRDIEPGKEWMPAIAEGLAGSRALVLVFSSRANESRHVAREVSIAFNEEIPIIPFRIENVAPGMALKYAIGTTHWLDALTPPLEQHLTSLADRVGALVDAQGEKPRGPAPDTRPVARVATRLFPIPVGVGAAVAVIVLATLMVFLLTRGESQAPQLESEAIRPAPGRVQPGPPVTTPESQGLQLESQTNPPALERAQPRPPVTSPRSAPPSADARRPEPSTPETKGSPGHVLDGYQRVLASNLRNAVKCTRVTMRQRTTAVADPKSMSFTEARKERSRLLNEMAQATGDRGALASHGLGFLAGLSEPPEFPFISCHTSQEQPLWSMANWRVWSAVREVRIGTSPDALSVHAPVSLSLEDIQAQELASRLGQKPVLNRRQPFWYGFLPAVAAEVYTSVVFHDGSSSDVVRVAGIQQLNLGR